MSSILQQVTTSGHTNSHNTVYRHHHHHRTQSQHLLHYGKYGHITFGDILYRSKALSIYCSHQQKLSRRVSERVFNGYRDKTQCVHRSIRKNILGRNARLRKKHRVSFPDYADNEPSELCNSASLFGSLPALKYLRSVGCRWNKVRACQVAVGNGQLHILQYARENSCPWDEYTCANAAENGHLKIIQYARKNGCPWNEKTCYLAAKHGHLHILQYAHQNGCP